MEALTKTQEAILEVIDEQLEGINARLKKYEPLIVERDRLNQTRRVLLSEKSTTGGGGRGNVQVTMEEIVNFLRTNGPSAPTTIAEGLGVDASVVRSHLNRHKTDRYTQLARGVWDLAEAEDEDEEEDEED